MKFFLCCWLLIVLIAEVQRRDVVRITKPYQACAEGCT